MKIVYTKDFEKSFLNLPQNIQEKTLEQETIFKNDILDPRLHIKRLKGNKDVDWYSFRVTRKYRVLFYWLEYGKSVVFYTMGHRKDVYE